MTTQYLIRLSGKKVNRKASQYKTNLRKFFNTANHKIFYHRPLCYNTYNSPISFQYKATLRTYQRTSKLLATCHQEPKEAFDSNSQTYLSNQIIDAHENLQFESTNFYLTMDFMR
ncbi:hypothetical protein KFK09_011818 [Dendrobium nobile]|uniref:Uncharacterized protein n=1 Tax=Dendrobium nobile TaxID=94219 RepID=A0A8T3BFK6_DENNO|nr:hypothetical protein KFK09_011817 [Dendrobium nobile]KAI0511193.1 hypothetical protein KFK09_011818 [Dendrobium nobile]